LDLLPSQSALASAADAICPLLAHFSKSASEQFPQYPSQYWDESASSRPLPVPFAARLKRSLTPPTGFIKPLVNPPQKPPDPPEPPNIPFKMGIADEDEQQTARSIIIGVAPFIFYNRLRK
jgi:hypothetical protein